MPEIKPASLTVEIPYGSCAVPFQGISDVQGTCFQEPTTSGKAADDSSNNFEGPHLQDRIVYVATQKLAERFGRLPLPSKYQEGLVLGHETPTSGTRA